ncbi:MAG: DCC1-like thiol-disulfide oxidoreductase family protein [Actinomycetota bacterium]
MGSGTERAELVVVHDATCEVCRRCRRWIEGQPSLVPIRFVEANDPAIVRWLGGMVPVGDELVVVDSFGRAWVGPDAFITCLWALTRYRDLAVRLQRPGARTLAKHAFHAVSAGRSIASLFLRTTGGDLVLDPALAPSLGAGSGAAGVDPACGDRCRSASARPGTVADARPGI